MSLFNLEAYAIAMIAYDTVSVTAFAHDTYDTSGRLEARGPVAPVLMRASVQPVSDMLDRKDSSRGFIGAATMINIYALGPIPMRSEIVIVGREAEGVYEVEAILNWASNGNYTKVLARQRNIPFEAP